MHELHQRIKSTFGVTHITHHSNSIFFSPSKDITGVRTRHDVPKPTPHTVPPYTCHHCPRFFNSEGSRGKHMKECRTIYLASSFPVGGGITDAMGL